MVARSYNNANTNGGVAYVHANNAASNTNTNIGSRLANRKSYSAESAMMKKMPGMSVRAAEEPRSLSSLTTPSATVKEVENHVRLGRSGE